MQIHANCRLARIYFNDKVKTEDEIPADYKLFMRVQTFKCWLLTRLFLRPININSISISMDQLQWEQSRYKSLEFEIADISIISS